MSCSMMVVCRCTCSPKAVHPTCCIHTEPAKTPQSDKSRDQPLIKANSTGGSSVYSLRSHFTEASSAASSLTLVDCETKQEPSSGPSRQTIDRIPEDCSTSTGYLVPKPLFVRNGGQPSLPQSLPPSYAELVDKPLPPLPHGFSTPVHQSLPLQTPPQDPLAHRKRDNRALSQEPRPNDLAALNRVSERAKHATPRLNNSECSPSSTANSQESVLSSKMPEPRSQLQSNQHSEETIGLGISHVRFGDRISEKRTDQKASSNRPRGHSHGLVQSLQRLWPTKLFCRPRSRSVPAPALAFPPRPPSLFPRAEIPPPVIQPQRVIRPLKAPERGPPPSPTTRMKRVVSALMEERVSFDFTTAAGTAELDQLLRRTRRVVADGLQPFGYQMKEIRNRNPLSAPATLPNSPMSKNSLYELDGCPLACHDWLAGPLPWVSTLRRVMDEVDSLEDLFSLALINRAAYTAFKTEELQLMKATVRKISPPAWELRQASEVPWSARTLPGGQSLAAGLYFRHYARDLCYVAGIKFLLLDYCQDILSEDLRTGLRDPSSKQAGELDAAVWRVWTFCHLFGNRKDREYDILGQKQWLRGEGLDADLPPVCQTSPDPMDFNSVLFAPHEGFAQGNPGGLSQKQLMHMLEVWTSMGVLLDFLRKETHRARRNGLFEGAATVQPRRGSKEEVRMLRSWLDFILTLGPAAVLELAPLGPNTDPDISFGRAASNGWTHWTPSPVGAPQSKFLSGVVRAMLRTSCASDDNANSQREILAEECWI